MLDMMSRYPDYNIIELFGQAVTNFFAHDGWSWISKNSCMINHSTDNANTGMDRSTPFLNDQPGVRYISTCHLKNGDEIFINYGDSHSKYFMSNSK